jgi:DNA-binding GntR family transcriptional regulator
MIEPDRTKPRRKVASEHWDALDALCRTDGTNASTLLSAIIETIVTRCDNTIAVCDRIGRQTKGKI